MLPKADLRESRIVRILAQQHSGIDDQFGPDQVFRRIQQFGPCRQIPNPSEEEMRRRAVFEDAASDVGGPGGAARSGRSHTVIFFVRRGTSSPGSYARTTTVRATEPTELYSLCQADFQALLAAEPAVREAVNETVAARRAALAAAS